MDGGAVSQTNAGSSGPGLSSGSTGGILTKSQRLILGLMILLLVDVIWVSSSELTKYLYTTAAFEKPFFTTYFKNSLFSLYLLGFLFWPPWRDQCYKPNNYMYIDPNGDDDSYFNDAASTLSDPTFEPVKGLSSGGGSESDESSVRSVRFSRVAEVRHMSEREAAEALIARLSYQASLRAGEAARRAADRLPLRSVARTALYFCFLWFMAQYTYQKALIGAEAGLAAVLSSTSSVFTLLLSAVFPSGPGDRLTVSKMAAVGLSMAGLGILTLAGVGTNTTYNVSANPLPMNGNRVSVLLALLSAFLYAAYVVLLRRHADNEEKLDIPLFFGFVGLFNFAFLWPAIFFLDYTRWESLEWPDRRQLTFLLVDGLVGTVVSEALWLWGCFLTSSVCATVSLTLTIPMSMAADLALKRVVYPSLVYLGSIPMFCALLALAVLLRYESWDPVLEMTQRLKPFIRTICCWPCRLKHIKSTRSARRLDAEQTESLLFVPTSEAGEELETC